MSRGSSTVCEGHGPSTRMCATISLPFSVSMRTRCLDRAALSLVVPPLVRFLFVDAVWTGDNREALAARAFNELSRLLESSASASAVQATVTIQTPQGLELCWINDLESGRKLLHGEDE